MSPEAKGAFAPSPMLLHAEMLSRGTPSVFQFWKARFNV